MKMESTVKSLTSHKVSECYIPKRFIVVILGFIGVLMNYNLRGILSVTMVAMVNNTQHSPANISIYSSECPASLETQFETEKKHFQGVHYNWDPKTQSYIMSGFFYSYFISVMMGGYFARRFGTVRVFGGGIFLSSLLSCFIPVAAKFGIIPLIIIRSLQGIFGGLTPAAMTAIVSSWSPKMERSVINTIIFTGSPMSTVIGNPISGWLCSLNFLDGWPSVFYISGLTGFIWFIFWCIFVYETPGSHPSISANELLHFPDDEEKMTRKIHEVPWIDILTSIPFLSVILAFIGTMCSSSLMLTELPTYLSTVLHFNVKTSGILSVLPFFAESIGAWISSYIADRLRSSGKWSITTIRKVLNSVAGYSLCICLLGITFSGCRPELIIGLLTIGMFLDGIKFAGYHACPVDMSTDFAGILYGLAYGISCIFGMLGPLMVGAFTESGATTANWSKVFYVTVAIKFVATTFYAVFSSAELQVWGKAMEKVTKKDPMDTKT